MIPGTPLENRYDLAARGDAVLAVLKAWVVSGHDPAQAYAIAVPTRLDLLTGDPSVITALETAEAAARALWAGM